MLPLNCSKNFHLLTIILLCMENIVGKQIKVGYIYGVESKEYGIAVWNMTMKILHQSHVITDSIELEYEWIAIGVITKSTCFGCRLIPKLGCNESTAPVQAVNLYMKNHVDVLVGPPCSDGKGKKFNQSKMLMLFYLFDFASFKINNDHLLSCCTVFSLFNCKSDRLCTHQE